MRKLLFIFSLLAAAMAADAQYAGYTPVADLVKFKTAFAAVALKTTSIKSDFTQDKNLSMLSEKITSKGNFWFKKTAGCGWNIPSLLNT